eukprot:360996_1
MSDDIDINTDKLSTDATGTKYTDLDNNSNSGIQLSPPNANTNNNNTENTTQPKDEFYTANAHRARRIYHVCIFAVTPIVYLWTAQAIADGIGITVPKILSFLILLAIIIEFIRLKKRFIIFGMREYERDHISAQSWGTISALIVLLLAFPRTYSIAPVILTDANGKSKG